jgi:lysozyme
MAVCVPGGWSVYEGVEMTAVDLVKQFEGYSATAYQCAGGKWTCGHGHTLAVNCETCCTAEQAEAWLKEDLAGAVKAVNALVHVPLTNNQREALYSFVFNVGLGNFSRSTLLKRLNAGDYSGAAAQFDRWAYADGKRLEGLARRRAAERALFETA